MQQAVRYILVAIIGTLLLSCVPTASEDFAMPEDDGVSISVPLRGYEAADGAKPLSD